MKKKKDIKIRNYGMVNYNRFKKQVEFTYFEKDEKGKWKKLFGQRTLENEVFVPKSDAVVKCINGEDPGYRKDLFGNPILVGVSCDFFAKNPPHVIRQCPKRFSYDIHPVVKFLSENFEFDEEKDEIPPLRVHYMDIETVVDDLGFIQGWNVGPDRDGANRGGVLMISSYDARSNTTHVFSVQPYTDAKTKLPSNVSYVWCQDERGVLREYMKYLKRTDPDIISGWNCLEGSQTVWLENKIVPISNISKKYENYPAFISGNTINKYGYTGEKKMFIIKTSLGKTIRCSKDHKFFVRIKDSNKYKKTSTIRKLSEQELSVDQIQKQPLTKDVFLEFKFGNGNVKDLTWRELIFEDSFWDRMICNPFIDIPIRNKEIISIVRKDRYIIDDYCWGENFWERSFEWNYKQNKHLYSAIELKNDLQSRPDFHFTFGNRRYSVDLDQTINEVDLQILGFIFTDGCWDHHRNAISLTQKYEEILQSYGNLLKENHDIKSFSTHRIKTKLGVYYSTKIAPSYFALLLNIIYMFNGDEKIKFPDVTLLSMLSKNQFFAYMSGCFDGDGCSLSSITLCNFDCQKQNYLELIHEILLWNGIISTVFGKGTNISIPYHEKNRTFIEYLKSHCLHYIRAEKIKLDYIKVFKDSSNKMIKYCYDDNGGFERICSIEETDKIVPMYDIETETHSFYTSGRKTHNCSDYDIPYILNRMRYHFGEQSLKHFGNGTAWIKNEARRFLTNGINIVDYMILYKKFELRPRRSYALSAIVDEEEVEIGGEGKLKFDGSFRDFYTRDWNGFVRYCIQDSQLVHKLDQKKKLLDTFVMCCYMAGISFDRAISHDVSWLRIHDAAIYRFCKEKEVELPEAREIPEESAQFLGAYVMEPVPGIYDYVTVFDVTSLYPSCIQALNISIDAYRGQVKKGDIVKQTGPFIVEFYSPLWLSLDNYSESILESINQFKGEKHNTVATRPIVMKFDTFQELVAELKSKNYCVGANGAIFTKDFRGVIPSLIDNWIAIRKKNKKLYFEYKQKYQKSGDPNDKALSERYKTIQEVYKIRLNSLYGFVGAKWSRFYHTDLAEAVTATGQYVLKSTMEHLKRKNPFFTALYCDTDSLFINYGKILDYKGIKITQDNTAECVKVCLEIDKEIKSAINENLDNITQNVMLTPNAYAFETEDVFSKMLITSKKKYVARIAYDKTTNLYPKNEFVIKGMEFKKSNLSSPIKEFLKDITVKMMDGMNRNDAIKMLREMFNVLPTLPIDDISYAQGVRSLWTYEKGANICIQNEKNAVAYFPKKTPYHIAGALVMNALIDWDPDLRDMNKVGEGDKAKIVFVCPTNIFGVKAIALVGSWHEKLYQYFKLDIEYMMQRLILGPLQPTFDAIKNNITMDDILQFKFLDADNTQVQLLLF